MVSWNDAADSHESVASDALVIPISTTIRRGLPALGDHPTVLGLEFATLGQRAGQELRRARVDDRDATQHLPDDHLDVLVVDRHTLSAVNLLDLLDEVDLHLAGALDTQHLVRVRGAFHQLLAHLDVVAVGKQPLRAVLVLEHLQPTVALGELVVDDFLPTVVRDDGDLVERVGLLERTRPQTSAIGALFRGTQPRRAPARGADRR